MHDHGYTTTGGRFARIPATQLTTPHRILLSGIVPEEIHEFGNRHGIEPCTVIE